LTKRTPSWGQKAGAFGLDSPLVATENAFMEILGRIHNGVVVLEGNSALPEGASVVVTYPAPVASATTTETRRAPFPLVRSANPGSVHLTNERIAEILSEEDVSS
jgi:hypothetical protein